MEKNMDEFFDLANKLDLPEELIYDMEKYFKFNRQQNKFLNIDQLDFLDTLPEQQVKQLILFSYVDIIKQVNLFKLDLVYTSDIILYINFYKVNSNKVIYRTGDPSNEFFIVLKGEVYILNEEGLIVLVIKEGSYFGEAELFLQTKRQFFAVSKYDGTQLIYI